MGEFRGLYGLGWWNRAGCAALAGVVLLSGCERFKPAPADHYVYVTSKQANLRDRVAAVSNRTGQVANGDKLKVLDHARHWVKVQTGKGEVGWIEEKAVIAEEQTTEFDKLKNAHKVDPTVASGVVRDQVYMHIAPGRETEHFYLLNEGDKLQLLRRATLEKTTTGATATRAQRVIPQAPGTNAVKKVDPAAAAAAQPATPGATVAAAIAKGKAAGSESGAAAAATPPAMEDWWLVRDTAGHTGWLYARMVDVDAPDALTRYAEGQKFVGAYVLSTVHDDEAPGDVKDVPIYVAAMAPYKAGLPYDYDQIRVFIWSLQHHRYETAFREKNIEGYLPVTISRMKDPAEKGALGQLELPAFTYKVLPADAPEPEPDPQTGSITPGKLIVKTYRLEGNLTRRISSGEGMLTDQDEAHPVPEEKKDKSKKSKKK